MAGSSAEYQNKKLIESLFSFPVETERVFWGQPDEDGNGAGGNTVCM